MFNVRRSKSFWAWLLVIVFINLGFAYFVALFSTQGLFDDRLGGAITFLSLLGIISASADVVFFAVTTKKHYGLMVDDKFYYCGKNIMDGATKTGERMIKRAYREYAAGDKETLYINKTTNRDLSFGVIDAKGGDKIVVFYYIDIQYDYIDSDEKLNLANVQAKYGNVAPSEEYRVVKLPNGKFAIERFYSIPNYFEHEIYELSPEMELFKDESFSKNYAEEYESEGEAFAAVQGCKKGRHI